MSRTLNLARSEVMRAVANVATKVARKQHVETRVAAEAWPGAELSAAHGEVEQACAELEEAFDQWERALVNTLEDRT